MSAHRPSQPRSLLRPLLLTSRAALLCAALWLSAAQAQAKPQTKSQPTRQPTQTTSDQDFQIAARGGKGPLDVGDEPPIGDLGIMRGKKNEFANRSYASKPNHWIDLAIILDASALLGLIVYVFASRR